MDDHEQKARPQRLIAIVEDDLAVLDSLEFALRAEGYAVCPLNCVGDAERDERILDADCVVLDYALPDGTGVALLKSLRLRGLQCPAIVIASNPSWRCREETSEVGAPLVEKPLMGETLSAEIRSVLSDGAA
jgi:DNA-binding response OmpR family regulator